MEGKRERHRRWLWLLLLLVLPIGFGALVLIALLDKAPRATGDNGTPVTTVEAFGEQVKVWQIAAGAAVGTGGLITLGTVFHRQSVQARAASDARYDADEKRAQELFVKAVEQLGHTRAAVRIGALHALDALGQEHAHRRRAVMDVWCAYLRMPPDETADSVGAQESADRSVWPADELQVRGTCQRLVTDHLRPPPKQNGHKKPVESAARFWGAMDIDLNGAHLHQIDFRSCRFHLGNFDDARFVGSSLFVDAEFSAPAAFDRARFDGHADFRNTTFAATAEFIEVVFAENAGFDNSRFAADTGFTYARFASNATFSNVVFEAKARFSKVNFGGHTTFDNVHITDHVDFTEARFGRNAGFDGSAFDKVAVFDHTRFRGHAGFAQARFGTEAWFAESHFMMDAGFAGATFNGDAHFEKAAFAAVADFGRSGFNKKGVFDETRFNSDATFATAGVASEGDVDGTDLTHLELAEGP